ncbi:hypothetical protein BD560DRAFT_212664 [Blakeslea trispora]|nr:hypothetical protein BD560DRAFT_212664 [Blakeslea trispora]
MESLHGISFITPTSSRLIDFMMPTEESMDCMPIISLPTLYCQSMRSREDLLEAWQDSNKAGSNLHQTAFMTICSHLKLKGLTSTRQTQPHHEFKALEDMLQQQAVDPLCQSKLYCCFALNHRSDNWLSLLKAMTQFIDLWIDDLEHSGCMNAYMALIVQQDLLSILFDKIHVHKCDVDLAKKICQLLKQCMDYGSLDQLLNLLDYAVSHQQTLDRMPAFDITDIWAFPYQSQLRKVCNQITLTEEDKEEGNMTIPLETLKVLTQLTIVWPWTTLKTLMELCLSNKNQYKAILPIFKTFKRILKDNLSFVNLLKVQMAIQMQSEYDSLQENTLQFINACCRSDHDSHIPTLLISENKAILLTVDQLIQTFVIPTLETCLTTSVPDTQLPLHSVRLCLALLCSLTESSQMDWTESVLDQSLREQTPCLFQSSISLLASLLTQLVDLRHKQTIVDYPIVRQLQLQDWELLVTFLERFVKLCSCAISQGQLDHIQHMIQTQGQQYTWQTQLFWLPIRPTLTHLPYPLSSLKIQEEKEILIEKEGWHVFFEACKLSTCMTDTLLIQGPFMPALCAHPFECSEILTGFQDVLYPQPLLTVASEYPKLMHYFLYDCMM